MEWVTDTCVERYTRYKIKNECLRVRIPCTPFWNCIYCGSFFIEKKLWISIAFSNLLSNGGSAVNMIFSCQ